MILANVVFVALSSKRLPSPLSKITRRERDVIALSLDGHANKEIAARLKISLETVKAHHTALRDLMGVRSRGQVLATIIDKLARGGFMTITSERAKPA